MDSRNQFGDPTDFRRELVKIEGNISSLQEQINRLSAEEAVKKETLSKQITELEAAHLELIAKNNANITEMPSELIRDEKNKALLQALMSHSADLTIGGSRGHKPTEYERTIGE